MVIQELKSTRGVDLSELKPGQLIKRNEYLAVVANDEQLIDLDDGSVTPFDEVEEFHMDIQLIPAGTKFTVTA